MRVSELITIKKIESWVPGDTITIKAGTGAGKSYFIKNNLYALAKRNGAKILMLLHRTNCRNQFIDELIRDKKTDVIDIMTYQKLEKKELNKKHIDLSQYKYIVCDEFHYFMSDASFNITTDISLNAILNEVFPVKIFMSATGIDMKTYINNIKGIPTIDYELPITYDYIKNLAFFNKDETLELFIEEAIKKNYKGIFFIQSAKKAYELYIKYKDYCLFNCSKSNNSNYYQYVDQDKIEKMLKDERFEEQILITTTCMDAGVNIIDFNLKHIVCDVKDIWTLVQCIGRKRIQNKKDKFNLYIKTISNQALGGMETQLNKKVKMADYLRTHTVKEYIDFYKRQYDSSNIVYDDMVEEDDKSTKKINELMFYKVKFDLSNIASIKQYGTYCYCKYLADMFGFRDNEGFYHYRIIEEDYETDKITKHLNKIVNQRLLKEGQQELIDVIDLRDSRGRQQKSIGQLNEYFKANNLKYIIVSKSSSEIVEGIKKNYRYWQVLNDIKEIELPTKYGISSI